MAVRTSNQVTHLLLEWSGGDQAALDRLMPVVYDELHRVAVSYLRREAAGHTLQPTALVHEAYLRLVDESRVDWHGRAHFFGAAARLMRQILVDHARRRHAAKRGGGGLKVTISEASASYAPPDIDLLALDHALNELSALDPQQSRVVEMRFFGGLSIEETAEVLAISPTTVKRDWTTAKAFLRRRLKTAAEALD
ncbi:MAG TPA: sigma-70 family RNA polymerase sigma factor [Blastocatellia bacterium]|nr:sigma-70 family RNA polymerase sigma factor [Blastocatellia bacterium]